MAQCQDSAQEAVINFMLGKDPTEDMEMSDLIDELYEAGATYVSLPITATVLEQGRDRKWSAVIVSDKHSTERINHYIADESSITMSEDS